MLERSTDDPERPEGFKKIYEFVKTRLNKAHSKACTYYNLRRRPVSYQIGDIVWHRNHTLSDKINYISAKLSPKYVGPFKVKRKMGNWTYELVDDSHKSVGIWHVQDLKSGACEEDT